MAGSTSRSGLTWSWAGGFRCSRCTTGSGRTCCSITAVNVTECPSSGPGWKRRASPSTWGSEMKTRAALFLILTLLAMMGYAANAANTAEAPKEGLCLVCKVHEGEADPEPVKATSVYKGQTYGFCSE